SFSLEQISVQDWKEAMGKAKEKLEGVVLREKLRQERYQSGKEIVVPQYFHATSASAAASIVQTGIEALSASAGFGAFFSNMPEFRYGSVFLGLPKEVELMSEIAT